MSEDYTARQAEQLAWLMNVVASRFPEHKLSGVQFAEYDSLGEIHFGFDMKKKPKNEGKGE